MTTTTKELQPCNILEHTVTEDGSGCLCGYFTQTPKDFESAVRPAIKYLAENHHPHTMITIDPTDAHLWEDQKMVRTEEYLVD